MHGEARFYKYTEHLKQEKRKSVNREAKHLCVIATERQRRRHRASTKPSDNWEENFSCLSLVLSRNAPGPQLLTSQVFVQVKLARRDKARQTACTVLCRFFFLQVGGKTDGKPTTAKRTRITQHFQCTYRETSGAELTSPRKKDHDTYMKFFYFGLSTPCHKNNWVSDLSLSLHQALPSFILLPRTALVLVAALVHLHVLAGCFLCSFLVYELHHIVLPFCV